MSSYPQAGSHETHSAAGSPAEGTVVGGRFLVGAPRANEPGFALHLAQDNEQGSEVSLLLVPAGRLGFGKSILSANLQKIQRAAPRNLARSIAFGEDQGFFYVASELPNGHALRSAVDARTANGETVGGKTAYTLLGHVAAGLTEAYSVMAHGALNPANITIGRDGKIVVEHWGVVQAVPDVARRGVPAGAAADAYVAPELASGGTPSAQSDVYAMGVMLYELLTGTVPGGAPVPPSRLRPEVPAAVDAVVGKSLDKSPLGRQGTPAALIAELGAALGMAAGDGRAAAPGLPPGLAGAPLPIGPSAAAALGVARVTGRRFNVAEAAGMAVDSERWLIQKGRLDFGPFSMAVLKQQIERGQFGLQDYITDTETGERKRIRDQPQLAEFTKRAERNIEATRRAHAEVSLQHSERKKGRLAAFIIAAAVLLIGSGFGIYMVNRRAAENDLLADRVAEADIDAFLKNVKIAFNQPKKPSAGRRSGAGGKAKPGADPFDTAQVLGDVTQGGGDAVLDEGTIQQVMMNNYRKLVPCIMQERGRDPSLHDVNLEFVVLGSGKVSAARVNGQTQGPFPSCIEGRLKTIHFPNFDGAKTVASWSMSIR